MILTTFKLRRDTAANWTTKNPTLKEGEPGFEKDTFKFKVGNGILTWINLPYASGAPGEGEPGPPGATGAAGASAYQVAVNNGFVGNQAAWLLSLKGDTGDSPDPTIVVLDVEEELPDPTIEGVLYLRLLPSGPVPDTTPPSIPTGLNSSGISATAFQVSWSASTDNVGVVGYQVRLGVGTPVDKTTLSHSFTGLTPETDYSVTVRAKDFADNWSDWSTALPVTTLADSPSEAVSIFGSSVPGSITGATDGPARCAMGFYTTLSGGIDVVGARIYLPSGLASSFYNNNVFVTTLVRNHTVNDVISANMLEQNGVSQNGFLAPLVAGWNEVLFEDLIHINPYSSGTNNAIWITALYATVPNYLFYSRSNRLNTLESADKSGLFLAEAAFPVAVNNITGSPASVDYPVDILVA